MPFASEHAAQGGADAVGDDDALALDRPLLLVLADGEGDGGDAAVGVALDVEGAGPFERHSSLVEGNLPDACVERRAGDCGTPVRQRAAGPGEQQFLTEPGSAEATVGAEAAQPVGEAQPVELGDRAWRQAVAAGLVPRERGGVGQDDVMPETRQPGRRRRPGRTGTDHQHVRLHGAILSSAVAAMIGCCV